VTRKPILYGLNHTRWFKYDRDKLWLVYTQRVPVIFEPPCIYLTWLQTETVRVSRLGRLKRFCVPKSPSRASLNPPSFLLNGIGVLSRKWIWPLQSEVNNECICTSISSWREEGQLDVSSLFDVNLVLKRGVKQDLSRSLQVSEEWLRAKHLNCEKQK
jgi:hypothetical protein